MTTNEINIGFIGLGLMGQPIAKHFIKAEYSIAAYARRVETLQPLLDYDVQAYYSPRELSQDCKVIITNVSDTPDAESIYPKRLRFRCLVRDIFLPWQGEMTSNSRDYCEEFQRSQGKNRSAIKPKSQSFWVYN